MYILHSSASIWDLTYAFSLSSLMHTYICLQWVPEWMEAVQYGICIRTERHTQWFTNVHHCFSAQFNGEPTECHSPAVGTIFSFRIDAGCCIAAIGSRSAAVLRCHEETVWLLIIEDGFSFYDDKKGPSFHLKFSVLSINPLFSTPFPITWQAIFKK